MQFYPELFDIEDRLYEECPNKGKVERIDYKTVNYDGKPMDKHAYVYTPYGYDEKERYEILYLIHGTGETAEKYLFDGGEENRLKRAVDNMINNGEIKPLIIVTPSQYPYHEICETTGFNMPFVPNFPKELTEDLMPAVESKYHTFADYDVSKDNLIKTREHHTIMGWSMGSNVTWHVFLSNISNFKRFGFISAPCFAIDGEPNMKWANESAKNVVEHVKKQGYTKKDYDIFTASGTKDIMFGWLSLLLGSLLAYPEYFDFYSEDKNINFLVWPDGEHHTKWRLQYTINALKQFFEVK